MENKKTMVCSNCRKKVEVVKEYTTTGLSHTAAIMLFPFLMCCLPYFIHYGSEVKYKCSECGAVLKHYF